MRATEGGSQVFAFTAPAAWLGDKSDYLSGTLSFDLKQDTDANQYEDSEVRLEGGGLVLHVDAGPNPGTDWTSYSVALDPTGGWTLGRFEGAPATRAEIAQVLADLMGVFIRGEYVQGTTGDASNLDNVVLREYAAPPPGPVITSTFDTDTEGWFFANDGETLRHVPTGGNPGGYLEVDDEGDGRYWYFDAPVTFLGDRAAFSGGTLSFDLKQSSTTSQIDNQDDIVLLGGGLRLAYDTADNPGEDWTSYEVTLDTRTDWRLNSIDGVAATQAQIDRVLADLEALRIRGEFVFGADTGGLDNVRMQAPGSGSPVIRYDNASDLNVVSTHAFFGPALAAAQPGNAIEILSAAAAPASAFTVNTGALTIISDAALTNLLALNGVAAITLQGANAMNVNGNALANRIQGSDGANTLNGFLGDDWLAGGGGNDGIYGGAGNDTGFGGDGADTIIGGDGDDVLLGLNGFDRLIGGTGNDRPFGGALADRLEGQGANDILDGEAGNDRLLGGVGFDTLIGGFGNDRLEGNSQNDMLFGGFGNDFAQGGLGNDYVAGGGGNDILLGWTGADTLTGGVGDDFLNGQSGNDLLEGGAGADAFAFDGAVFGTDFVVDFEPGIDTIRLTGDGSAANFLQFRANSEQVGTLVVHDMGGDGQGVVTLAGVTLGQLSAENFDFG